MLNLWSCTRDGNMGKTIVLSVFWWVVLVIKRSCGCLTPDYYDWLEIPANVHDFQSHSVALLIGESFFSNIEVLWYLCDIRYLHLGLIFFTPSREPDVDRINWLNNAINYLNNSSF